MTLSFFIHTYDKSNNLIQRNSLFKQLNINYGRNGLGTKRTMAERECGRNVSKVVRLSPLLADVNNTSINSFCIHYSEQIHVQSIVFRNNINVCTFLTHVRGERIPFGAPPPFFSEYIIFYDRSKIRGYWIYVYSRYIQ